MEVRCGGYTSCFASLVMKNRPAQLVARQLQYFFFPSIERYTDGDNDLCPIHSRAKEIKFVSPAGHSRQHHQGDLTLVIAIQSIQKYFAIRVKSSDLALTG
jgi:hypothetical protein